jgi:hypothetical protein
VNVSIKCLTSLPPPSWPAVKGTSFKRADRAVSVSYRGATGGEEIIKAIKHAYVDSLQIKRFGIISIQGLVDVLPPLSGST